MIWTLLIAWAVFTVLALALLLGAWWLMREAKREAQEERRISYDVEWPEASPEDQDPTLEKRQEQRWRYEQDASETRF